MVYAYNANGDLISDGLRTYSYNAEGRLSAVTTGATDASPTTRYAHNALGQRVFKTEPLYPPSEGDESDPGFFQGLIGFFTKLWGPNTTDAEKLGFAFMYDEDGTLLAETGMGGANSAGSTQYIYLPTAGGPMPVAAVINGQLYAVHSDHLNTPRRLTNSNGQAVWQWAYSAFGQEKPTLATNRFANLDINPNPGTTGITSPEFNLRYWGMYGDKESKLLYNGRRSYRPDDGVYTQNDPAGLGGGLNRRAGLDGNPLGKSDPTGLSTCRWIGPVLQCNWGPPPSLDPENPYGRGAPPNLGLTIPSYTMPGAIIGACEALTNWMFSGSKTPEQLIDESTKGRDTKGRADQWNREGGREQRDQDFDSLGVQNVKDRGNGVRTGTLPDGRPINAHDSSTGGVPTIQIGNGSRDIKIRYP